MTTNIYKGNEVIYLPADKILPNPYQSRSNPCRDNLNELVASVKRYGVLQPISVRLINNRLYELVFGERRLRATKLAGLESIPAIVIELSDRDAAAVTMSENIQRSNLHYLEEAEGIRILYEGFKYSINEISHILSISEERIKELLRFCSLSSDVRALLSEKAVPMESAALLLRTDDSALQRDIIDKISRSGLSREKAEILVNSAIRTHRIAGNTEKINSGIKKYFSDIRLFTNTIKQAVGLMNESGMETAYEMEKNNNEYLINIKVKIQ